MSRHMLTDSGAKSRPVVCAPRRANSIASYPRLCTKADQAAGRPDEHSNSYGAYVYPPNLHRSLRDQFSVFNLHAWYMQERSAKKLSAVLSRAIGGLMGFAFESNPECLV